MISDMNNSDKETLLKQLSPITQYLVGQAIKEGIITTKDGCYQNEDNMPG